MSSCIERSQWWLPRPDCLCQVLWLISCRSSLSSCGSSRCELSKMWCRFLLSVVLSVPSGPPSPDLKTSGGAPAPQTSGWIHNPRWNVTSLIVCANSKGDVATNSYLHRWQVVTATRLGCLHSSSSQFSFPCACGWSSFRSAIKQVMLSRSVWWLTIVLIADLQLLLTRICRCVELCCPCLLSCILCPQWWML